MPLRKADITATKKFEDGTGDDKAWLVLRLHLTKGEGDAVRDLTASYKINPSEVANASPEQAMNIEISNRTAQANCALFEILCQSWSLGEVSGEAYSDLDEPSGRWVDSCIQEVLKERRVRAEGNAPSSSKRPRRAVSSPRATG